MANFTQGDYQYTIIDSTNNYVSAKVVDTTKTSYTDIPSTVTNNNITYTVTSLGVSGSGAANGCFSGCTNLIKAPKIPQTVTEMYATFCDCSSLVIPPIIPEGVRNMWVCFSGCSSLLTAPIIPEGVYSLANCFQYCPALTSVSYIPASVTSMYNCFSGCTNLNGTIFVDGVPTNNINNANNTSVFENTSRTIFLITNNSKAKEIWKQVATNFQNVFVVDKSLLSIFRDDAKAISSISFGGYEDASLKSKATSYFDTVFEKDVLMDTYSADTTDQQLIELIDNNNWEDVLGDISRYEPFHYEIANENSVAQVGFVREVKSFINSETQEDKRPTVDLSKFTAYVAPTFQYSYNNQTWSNYTLGTLISIGKDQASNVVYFRGNNLGQWYDSYTVEVYNTDDQGEPLTFSYTSEFKTWIHGVINNANVRAKGNIMSLRYTDFVNQTVLPCDSTFRGLFIHCETLIAAPVLPATTLKPYCYAHMFYGSGIVTAPKLPAMVMQPYCYSGMFGADFYSSLLYAPKLPAIILAEGCYGASICPSESSKSGAKITWSTSSGMFGRASLQTPPELPALVMAPKCYQYMFDQSYIKTPPELPATTLAESCYEFMFGSTTSLEYAPKLPATNLAINCYRNMFSGSSITQPPTLSATTLADGCYYGMFSNSKITSAPVLPATTLADSCYYNMFSKCSQLVNPPTLSATTLADSCYHSMFSNSAITSAPTLSATTLADRCYYSMFEECTNLTIPPALPATTLADYCYRSMFDGCTSLTKIPKLPATAMKDYCYSYMYNGSNVKANATSISGCSNAFRIPTSGTGEASSKGFSDMFPLATDTSQTYTPDLNTTFYISVPSF